MEVIAGLDTAPHRRFTTYSAGNFGEVAPQRLSPLSWSLVGEPMERATRSLCRRIFGPATRWIQAPGPVFVGYFGCRPYHNLSAYCYMAECLPGVSAEDVTASYFEDAPVPDIPSPPRTSRAQQGLLSLRLARELHRLDGSLTTLEEATAELEGRVAGGGLSAAMALDGLVEHLERCWEAHITSTGGLIPLHAFQGRANARLLPHADELAPWLGRPDELVWHRLFAAGDAGGRGGPGEFLDRPFYEVADRVEPWSDFVLPPPRSAALPDLADRGSDIAEHAFAMLPGPVRSVARVLDSTVGSTLAAREHSKSLVMRTLHLFRTALPVVADALHVDDESCSLLTVGELRAARRTDDLARLVDARRDAVDLALAGDRGETLEAEGASVAQVVTERPGRGVSPGVAQGVIVTSIDDLDPSQSSILLVTAADAGAVPMMRLVRGVIAARGSALSHIAILAREMGLPAVVGHPLVSRLAPGDVVLLDGTTGEVEILGR